MSKLLMWQQEYIEHVNNLSNNELFQEILEDAHGDSWGGCFTTKGFWKYTWICNELRIRLEKIGFLEEDK